MDRETLVQEKIKEVKAHGSEIEQTKLVSKGDGWGGGWRKIINNGGMCRAGRYMRRNSVRCCGRER